MPAQVLVVRRPRRSLFAFPRTLPDWVRSVWATLFRTSTIDTNLCQTDSAGPRSLGTPLFPRLARDEGDSHRCVGCGLCVQVCPSRCLRLGTEGQGDGLEVTRFELMEGACIGCGFCDEACPEKAIELRAGLLVELAPISGRPGVTDLLDRVDLIQDEGRMQNGRD